jgi:hypothetical protein
VIYTYPYFWLDYMGNTTWFATNGYRVLWIAHYDVQVAQGAGVELGRRGLVVVQLSDCGRVAGIEWVRRRRPVQRDRPWPAGNPQYHR